MTIDMNRAKETYRRTEPEPSQEAGDVVATLPELQPFPALALSIGSEAARALQATHASMAAMGAPFASLGCLDGPAPRANPPAFIVEPGFRAPHPRIYQLHERNLEGPARAELPRAVWEDLAAGHQFVDTVAVERGLSGNRSLGPKAAAAEEFAIQAFLGQLVRPLTPARASGLDSFLQAGERPRVPAYVFVTFAGAVGSGMGLELCYRLGVIARQQRLDLDLNLVVLGSQFFGAGTPRPLQPYLEANEQAAWDELREANEKGLLRVGHRMVELERPLFEPGHIILLDEAPVDGNAHEFTPEAQAKYIDYIGLTMATAILGGALDRAQALENPTVKPDELVRRLRFAGYGFDRWAVASALSGAAERRVLARWEELLAPAAS